MSLEELARQVAIKLPCGKGLRLVEFLRCERRKSGDATPVLGRVTVTYRETTAYGGFFEQLMIADFPEVRSEELRLGTICVEMPQQAYWNRVAASAASLDEAASAD